MTLFLGPSWPVPEAWGKGGPLPLALAARSIAPSRGAVLGRCLLGHGPLRGGTWVTQITLCQAEVGSLPLCFTTFWGGRALGICGESEGTEVQRGGCVSPRNPLRPLLAAWECPTWPQAKSCLRDSASCTPTGFPGPQFPHVQSGSQFLAQRAVGCRARVNGCCFSYWTAARRLPQSHSMRSSGPEDGERVGSAALLVLNAGRQSAFLS